MMCWSQEVREQKCPDCGRWITIGYRYAMHRGFKHDDWKLLDEWYEKRGKENPYV